MPIIRESDAREHHCPFNHFSPCVGAKCMAWQWHGQPYERKDTNNLIETQDGRRPSDMLPAAPLGEGWEREGDLYQVGYENSAKLKLPKATAQRWVRRIERTLGTCGRIAHDIDYEIPF